MPKRTIYLLPGPGITQGATVAFPSLCIPMDCIACGPRTTCSLWVLSRHLLKKRIKSSMKNYCI